MALAPQRSSAATAYVEQEIRSADPVALIANVFEVAVRQAATARAALAASDWAAKGVAVDKLTRCIGTLQASLDMERGGDVARSFDRVYSYLLTRVMHAHARNDDAAFAEVARHLGELAAAWRSVCAPAKATTP
jgi:flagellar protein FliS